MRRSDRIDLAAGDLFSDADAPWHGQDRQSAAVSTEPHGHDPAHEVASHDGTIGTFTVFPGTTIDWPPFVEWLELLLASRGDSILRVKGLLDVNGRDGPLVLQGVQHVLYPPEQLPTWPPSSPPGGWIVFIARDLTRNSIERSLQEMLAGEDA